MRIIPYEKRCARTKNKNKRSVKKRDPEKERGRNEFTDKETMINHRSMIQFRSIYEKYNSIENRCMIRSKAENGTGHEKIYTRTKL